MLKRIKWFAIFIVITFVIVYIAMVISVMPIINEGKSVFINTSTDIADVFQRYSTERYGQNVQRRANIIPLFVFHNGHDGYIYVVYSYEVRDETNNILGGSWDIISKWQIAKGTNGWRVVDIIEEP